MKTSTTALPKLPRKPASGVRLLRTGRRADDAVSMNRMRSALGMRGGSPIDAWLAPDGRFFTRAAQATREWPMPEGSVHVGRYSHRIDPAAFVADLAAARAELKGRHAPV